MHCADSMAQSPLPEKMNVNVKIGQDLPHNIYQTRSLENFCFPSSVISNIII